MVVSGGGWKLRTNKVLVKKSIETGEETMLTPSNMAVSSPATSPDGTKVAFLAMPREESQGMLQGEMAKQTLLQRKIWIVNAQEQSEPRPLTSDPA